jgi:hypothetical protein
MLHCFTNFFHPFLPIPCNNLKISKNQNFSTFHDLQLCLKDHPWNLPGSWD